MKDEVLQICLIQTALYWEDPKSNREMFKHYFKKVPEGCNLIVLPEMFTSGFTMNPHSVAETMTGDTVTWLKFYAQKMDCAICGSIVVLEASQYYNRFLFVKPDGEISHYDKRHTFNMAGEGKMYKAGNAPVLIRYRGWKLFPQICYDLRFPVFSRNTVDYDLCLYVANWPKTRITAWDTLLKARAIENMSYVVGVNRVGKDGNDLEYVGHSAIYDTLGEDVNPTSSVTAIEKDTAGRIMSFTLSRKRIKDTRATLPFLEDKDSFTLH